MTTNPPSIAKSAATDSVNAGADTTKSEQIDKGISFKWLFAVLGSAALSLLAFYYFIFGYRLEMGYGNQADFGAFGDFLGGVLNPILGFATVGLLIWSLKMQRDELTLTRQVLDETKQETTLSRQAMQEQVEHLKNDSSLKEIRELLSMQMSLIDECYKSTVLTKKRNDNSTVDVTLEKIVNDDTDILPYLPTIKNLAQSETPNPITHKIQKMELYVAQYATLIAFYCELTSNTSFAYTYVTVALSMASNVNKICPSEAMVKRYAAARNII